MADFFDLNTWGTDSHLQFLNWTVDNNGAYDYAANTRGYTDGALIEYDDHWCTVRFAEALMPKGREWHPSRRRYRSRARRKSRVRGSRQADCASSWHRTLAQLPQSRQHGQLSRSDSTTISPARDVSADIISTRREGRHKYGFGLNFEQEITPQVGVFGRLGWSDGRNESFAYTEVDRTFSSAGLQRATRWQRHNDRAGHGLVANGIVDAPSGVSRARRSRVSFSVMAASLTARRKSSKVSTPRISGAASSPRSTCSTSIIPATTKIAARSPFPACASTSTSDRLSGRFRRACPSHRPHVFRRDARPWCSTMCRARWHRIRVGIRLARVRWWRSLRRWEKRLLQNIEHFGRKLVGLRHERCGLPHLIVAQHRFEAGHCCHANAVLDLPIRLAYRIVRHVPVRHQ